MEYKDALRRLAARGAAELDGADAADLLRWTDENFGANYVVASNMQDAVLIDMAAKIRPGVDVVFLDTGYHFPETLGTRDAVAATLPVTIKTITPRQTVAEQDASFGARLYERNPDQCCALRKVNPLRNALKDYTAWASGLRRDEADGRRHIGVIEFDARRSMMKINPIAAWTQQDVDAYIADNGVIVNTLLFDGYGSVGCAPCTRRVKPGEDARAGRWAGMSKTECGIHD